MKTRKWTHPSGMEEIVEVGSPRDVELMDKLRVSGLWTPAYKEEPQPEGMISLNEYLEMHKINEDSKNQ